MSAASVKESVVVDPRFSYDAFVCGEEGSGEKKKALDGVLEAWRQAVIASGIRGQSVTDGLRCLQKLQWESRGGRIVWVTERETKKVCGVASIYLGGKDCQIQALAASPSHWPDVKSRLSKVSLSEKAAYVPGAGAALFYSLCSHLKGLGVEKVEVFPYEHARDYYHKVGMTEIDPMYWNLQLDLRERVYVADRSESD